MMTSLRNLLLSVLLTSFLLLPAQAQDNSEAVLELFQRIDALNNDIRTLRGENEQLQHEIGKLKQSQKEGFLNVDDRIDALSAEIKAASKAANPSVTARPSTPPTQAPTQQTPATQKPDTTEAPKAKLTGTAEVVSAPLLKARDATAEESQAYQQAYARLKQNPSAAIQSFNAFIIKYPESPLAANSQYWIGEIMYSQKNYKGAVDEFVKVLQNYKKSEKAPDAAIKLGFSFYELKNWVYARRALEDVARYFPNTRAASLAKQRIDKMKADGNY